LEKKYSYIIKGTLILLVPYFVATFFFSLSKKDIPKNVMPLYIPFQVVFYQKWGFFKHTEPFNYRLYYEVTNRNTGAFVARMEVLQDIRKLATREAPFNQRYLLLDVILGRCITEVLNTDPLLLENSQSTSGLKRNGPLRTLENYAAIAAAAYHIDTAGNGCRLIIMQENYNDFTSRNMPPVIKAQPVFEGKYFNFR